MVEIRGTVRLSVWGLWGRSALVQVLSPALPGLQAPTRRHLAAWAQGPPTGTSSPLQQGWGSAP